MQQLQHQFRRLAAASQLINSSVNTFKQSTYSRVQQYVTASCCASQRYELLDANVIVPSFSLCVIEA